MTAVQEARERAFIHDINTGEHVPAPLAHRGRDTTVVFDDHHVRYMIDQANPNAIITYIGPTVEVYR